MNYVKCQLIEIRRGMSAKRKNPQVANRAANSGKIVFGPRPAKKQKRNPEKKCSQVTMKPKEKAKTSNSFFIFSRNGLQQKKKLEIVNSNLKQ